MRVTDINQLIDLKKIIPKKENVDDWYSGNKYFDNLKHTCKKNNINFNDCIIYAVNIFLDKDKNKYKNTKPLPCIIKYGSHFWDGDSNFCLLTIENDIWTEHYRYNYIEKIDEILLNGEAFDRGSLTYKHKFPYLRLFTTKKEAYEYIDNYRKQNDITKYKEKLFRITADIEILIKEKERLENLIKEYESNN